MVRGLTGGYQSRVRERQPPQLQRMGSRRVARRLGEALRATLVAGAVLLCSLHAEPTRGSTSPIDVLDGPQARQSHLEFGEAAPPAEVLQEPTQHRGHWCGGRWCAELRPQHFAAAQPGG